MEIVAMLHDIIKFLVQLMELFRYAILNFSFPRDYQARTAIMSSMSNVLLLVITIMTLLSINSATLSSESCATNSECQPSSCCLLGLSLFLLSN